MIKNISYVSIKEILSRLLRHPLLQRLNIEQVVQYTLDFIGIVGMPKFFVDKEVDIEIKDFRGLLPCDLVAINLVKDCKTRRCLRSMTDEFNPREDFHRFSQIVELSFKTHGNIIYTSFKEGDVKVSYKAIPVDEDGYPMLIDNAVFLKALEAYIKKEEFTILFDLNKVTANVYSNVQQQYGWLAGQCQSEFTIPSISEMESIANSWTTLIQNVTSFERGFKDLGDKEHLRLH